MRLFFYPHTRFDLRTRVNIARAGFGIISEGVGSSVRREGVGSSIRREGVGSSMTA